MVCLGNICRSPLAEGILNNELTLLGKKHIVVQSAGTASFHVGEHPDNRAIKIAKKHNIDISKHKAQMFKHKMFENFDRIYVMDKSNYYDVITLSKNEIEASKVDFLLNFTNKCPNQDVIDPWYGNENDFEKVFTQLENVCSELARSL